MLQGKKVTVIGSGISGIAAAKLLKRHQADVTVYDGNAGRCAGNREKLRSKGSLR